MEKILEACCADTGFEKSVVEAVTRSFLKQIADELVTGNSVDLGTDFGILLSKLRVPHQSEQSVRTPKDSRYKVVFKESAVLRQRLKVG